MTNYYPEGWLIDTAHNKNLCQSPAGLCEAMNHQTILEARACLCTPEHDLVVDFGFCKGIIPRCEGAIGIREGTTRDIALLSRVNHPVCFVIQDIRHESDGRITPILSRLAAQQRCQKDYLSHLKCGDIIPACVTRLESFGAFVDIGCGIASLIPIDCICVSRISHPSDRFCCGQDIKAVIREIEPSGRICLSHKELLGTWEENASLFHTGETVCATVRSVENYGIFVELAPNLAGLAEPKKGVQPGQQAGVYIKSILPDKMKIKLILIDSFDAPAPTEPAHYFILEGHLDHWVYSPECCGKTIETVFCPEEE